MELKDQIIFNDKISKPVGPGENDQKKNKILKFDNDNKIIFDERAKEAGDEAYIINKRNVLGFREEAENNMFGGRNQTILGDSTEEANFSYNGGVEDNKPNYFDKDDENYKVSDFEVRTNKTFIVDGMNVNQLRNLD